MTTSDGDSEEKVHSPGPETPLDPSEMKNAPPPGRPQPGYVSHRRMPWTLRLIVAALTIVVVLFLTTWFMGRSPRVAADRGEDISSGHVQPGVSRIDPETEAGRSASADTLGRPSVRRFESIDTKGGPAGPRAQGGPTGMRPIPPGPVPTSVPTDRANHHPENAPILPEEVVTLNRYPGLDSPDGVKSGEEFAVQILLSEHPRASGTRIERGDTTVAGALALKLPAPDSSRNPQWKLDVVLTAPGFSFVRGSNTGSLTLSLEGDSSPGLFYLVARPMTSPREVRRISASLWHSGTFVSSFSKDIHVFEGDPLPVAVSSSRVEGKPVALDLTRPVPDLTILLLYDLDQGDSMSLRVIVDSPYLLMTSETVRLDQDLEGWLQSRYKNLHSRARGIALESSGLSMESSATSKDGTVAYMRGFGRELYDRFAPESFKQAFWRLKEKIGPQFDTILVYSNHSGLPWELMRPISPDRTDEVDFLGTEFQVARWHVTSKSHVLDRPPEELRINQTVLLVPVYSGSSSLPSVGREAIALSSLPGFVRIDGTMSNLSRLSDLPAGILHFAGHGVVAGTLFPEYGLKLSDGVLDLETFRGLARVSETDHPLIFLNACDLGQVDQICGFVDGWAPAAIELGAGGFIGGLWQLGDEAAADFAVDFYDRLQPGDNIRISEVVRQCRKRFFDKGDPTSLAYVYYGSPFMRLKHE